MFRISAIALTSILILTGCAKEQPKSKPNFIGLPQKIEVPPVGKVEFISPQALMDSLNAGIRLPLIYLEEAAPTDPSVIIPLPRMEIMNLGDLYQRAPKLPHDKPLYLICLYGDDSKRMAKEVAKDGYNCYYLDGGLYRFTQEMRKNGWKIPAL